MTQSRHPALVPLAKSPKACIACAACTLLCMHKYHSRNLARRLESKQARNFGMLDYPSAWGPQSREGENLAFSPLRPILFPNPSYALRISGLLWTVNKEHLKVLQHGKSCKPTPPPISVVTNSHGNQLSHMQPSFLLQVMLQQRSNLRFSLNTPSSKLLYNRSNSADAFLQWCLEGMWSMGTVVD